MSRKPFLTRREVVLFGLFPAVIFAAQQVMAVLPNVHLTGMLIALMTLLFRAKALLPLYVYVLFMGVYGGFTPWWVPYLYVWTVLWALFMLIPKKVREHRAAAIVYPILCSLHGFAFGALWSLSQPLLTGLDFKLLPAWILAGLPFDVIHGISNFCFGLLIYPLCKTLLPMLERKR